MKELAYIVFGWALTVSTATAAGILLIRMLRLRLHRSEEFLLGFVLGSAALSTALFALCALHIVYKGVLLGLAAGMFWLAAIARRGKPPETPLSPVPRVWIAVLGVVLAAFGVLYFFNALAPESSPDGAGYHLPFAALYYRSHGFVRVTWDMYADLTEGIELLFMMAFAFGRHSAAALVHASFLFALPLLMLAYARRFAISVSGAAAAVLVFASPVVGRDGSCAYIDVALAAVLFGLFYFLQLWDEDRNWRWLIAVGILAGFAFATKYTAVAALPYAIGLVVWKTWRRGGSVWRPAVVVTLLGLAVMTPWLVKNILYVNNPVAPFANRIFPNRYFHLSAERDYRSFFRSYDLASYTEIPLEVTVRGQRLSGLCGPLFLLAPLALFALRYPIGRQLLLAAVVLGSTYFTNIGTRFLIPILPFVALALALAFQNLRGLLLVLVLAHAVLSWPSVLSRYCSQYAWRLEEIPFAAALRIVPQDRYLSQHWGPYLVDRMLDEKMGAADKVFSFGSIPEAYTSRQVLVSQNAAENEMLRDVLLTAMLKDFQPASVVEFHFAERALQRIRIVQTGRSKGSDWTVSEIRVSDQGREFARAPSWRLNANPNPWDVGFAFDQDLVTRWRSWQYAAPGMFIEIDFGSIRPLDSVRVESAADPSIHMTLEGLDQSEHWVRISDSPQMISRPVTENLRRPATEQLKRRGVRYLLVDASDYGAQDFFAHPADWGLREVGRRGDTHLYLIE